MTAAVDAKALRARSVLIESKPALYLFVWPHFPSRQVIPPDLKMRSSWREPFECKWKQDRAEPADGNAPHARG
jgi:hypothetical protein